MNRARLAEFLRSRRESLQPEGLGLPRGPRRRTPGLRRDEVAELSGISTDYYTRIEQPHGPVPSAQVLDAIARGLRLTPDEHDHLLRLAGYAPTPAAGHGREVSPGLRRVLDRLRDEPALIVNDVGETLLQTRAAVALLGDETRFRGLMRSRAYRWFVDPTARQRTPADDHAAHARALVAQLERAATSGPRSPAHAIVAMLRAASDEFEQLWTRHPVAGPYCEAKRLLHDEVGELVLHGETLLDPDGSQALTVFTAEPGSESERRLELLTTRSGEPLQWIARPVLQQA